MALCSFCSNYFFNRPERRRVCVCAFTHPCICVKTAQADNAWPDLKVTSLTCSADWACEAIRSMAIFFAPGCLNSGGFYEDHDVLDEERALSIFRCIFVLRTWLPCALHRWAYGCFFPLFSLFACFHQPTWDCSIWEWILSEIYSLSERLCYWRVSFVGFTHRSCATAQSVTFTQVTCILYKSYFWSCHLVGMLIFRQYWDASLFVSFDIFQKPESVFTPLCSNWLFLLILKDKTFC